ncbi:MAG: transketolase family protein [Firmicutes bacterium]|nr:transketolase family protein [Bacillota bacterium]
MVDEKKSVRDAVAEALLDFGASNSDLLVLDADLASSTRVNKFQDRFPHRFFQMGIAEQNMVGVAAGLAAMGFIPFTSTFACFAAKRATDQIRVSVAQPKLNVKIMGAYAGLFTGKTGKTHQSVMDIAVMRAMPNMVVLEPADAVEARQMVAFAIDYDGPVYLRTTRDPVPVVFSESHRFELAKPVAFREGKDVTIIGQGYTTHKALEAAAVLERQGVSATVIHVPTFKPFDPDVICQSARRTGAVVTVENHSIIGGLGSLVAESLAETWPTPVRRVGIMDTFGESGPNSELEAKYGLNTENIVRRVNDLLGLKEEIVTGMPARHGRM